MPRMVGGGVIFCVPVNLANASGWNAIVADALFAAGYLSGNLNPRIPKTITIKAHVLQRFARRNSLRIACRPIPAALKAFGVIHDDGDACPHTFVYDQVIDRGWQGVEVEVRPL